MRNPYRFSVIAAAALLTNGLSLLGIGEQSAGAIARALECKNCLNRKSEIVCAVEHAGQPLAADCADRERWHPGVADVQAQG
jgi:hypothetical protein